MTMIVIMWGIEMGNVGVKLRLTARTMSPTTGTRPTPAEITLLRSIRLSSQLGMLACLAFLTTRV